LRLGTRRRFKARLENTAGSTMFKIWGRKDGSNVIKVTWCLGEIGVDYERIDWGGPFGGNDDPDYRRKNPNGRLPTLE
jgi:glutathione S-transferase